MKLINMNKLNHKSKNFSIKLPQERFFSEDSVEASFLGLYGAGYVLS